MKKIGVLGNFGGGEIGGQVTKTIELTNAFVQKYGKVNKVDVNKTKKKYLVLIKQIWKLLKQSTDVFIILASPGYFKILPIIIAMNTICKCNIYENVIGGVRNQYVEKKSIRLWLEKHIKKIYVESNYMAGMYKKIGLNNVEYLPNFKQIEKITEEELLRNFNKCSSLQLCTFSRIDRYKGIDEAINIIECLNEKYDKIVAHLDIIGPVDEEYRDEFEKIMQEVDKTSVQYCGKVDSKQAVEVLKKYDALLFPTKWITEGFPGSFIDAMAAGLPILASERENFKDIVLEDYNGYLIAEEDRQEEFINRIYSWYVDREKLFEMKKNSLHEVDKYKVENVVRQLWEDIGR